MPAHDQPKALLVPIIGSDFMDGEVRHTCFQLCRHKASGDGLEAVAVLVFEGEQTSYRAIAALQGRERAIVRLALAYRNRSIPQRFTRPA